MPHVLYLGLGRLYLICCRAAQKAAFTFPGNWIVALWPSVSTGEPSVQLWEVVTRGIFCTLATNGHFLIHPKTLCSKMGRNYFSSSNSSIALAKWTATHFSLRIGITSMLASIVWVFRPQIKIRVYCCKSRNGYLYGILQATDYVNPFCKPYKLPSVHGELINPWEIW